ncbi:unnamed protein product [Notodromas monacha]|uniref:Uncharacterized protein n=1 Tax=Notodromas monacha TaxID=399045 RepID=A0A7R9GED5_9CRUS|nr:unnamed protein product [Notodromas monacha]CAG0917753.1 unnamed protein product [Notodromas monacha]
MFAPEIAVIWLHVAVFQLPGLRCEANYLQFAIGWTWDRKPVVDHEKINVTISPGPDHSKYTVDVKFSGPILKRDPQPDDAQKGAPYPWITEYECAQAFFANEEGRYLQVIMDPYGSYQILLHDGYRAEKSYLRAASSLKANGSWWEGKLTIPVTYFPPRVTKFNAAAEHGQPLGNRSFEVLHPQDPDKHPYPDAHVVQYFQTINFYEVCPGNREAEYSMYWLDVMSAGSSITVSVAYLIVIEVAVKCVGRILS